MPALFAVLRGTPLREERRRSASSATPTTALSVSLKDGRASVRSLTLPAELTCHNLQLWMHTLFAVLRGTPLRAERSRGASRATPTTALSVKPPVKMSRVSLKGARASVRSLTMPEEVTPPLSTSRASSHSLRSRSGARSGS